MNLPRPGALAGMNAALHAAAQSRAHRPQPDEDDERPIGDPDDDEGGEDEDDEDDDGIEMI